MLRLNHHKSIESEENIVSLDNDSILKLVKLTDTNLHVVDIYSERKRGVVTQIIEATLSYPLSHCPHCHSQNLILNGKRTVNAKLTSINGSPIQLRVHRQRYLCHACGRTCGAQSNNLTFNHTLTPGVAQQTIKLAKQSLAGTTIAALTGISNTSVARIINAEVHRPYRLKELPENVCFDEFRSTGHYMSFICCDADSHRLVVTLPGRLSKDIIDYFESRYSLTERKRVKRVVVDLNAQYCQFIHRLFPNAESVIDRFHIIQLVGRALDAERLRVLHTIEDHKSRLYKALKSQWKLLHKDQNDLNTSQPVFLRGINEYMTQQNAVDLALSADPRLASAYQSYQDLLADIRGHRVQDLGTLLNNYQPKHSAMDTAMTSLKKNYQAVINSCRFSYSNGPIEGINRKIKTLKRNGYGFRNLTNFFNRIALIRE